MMSPALNLAYCTNVWTHHQSPVCTELARLLGEDHFTLCLFATLSEERRKLGYSVAVPAHPWIAGPPTSPGETQRLIKIVCDADVAVLGSCPQEVRAARAATGKLTLIMSERMWKRPFHWWRMLNPHFARGIQQFRSMANRENVHELAIGAYAAADVRRIRAYGDRVWSWAYFAELAPRPPPPRTSGSLHVLWVGRMLRWKRVDLLLQAVALVRHHPSFARLDVVGTGPEKTRLQNLARELDLRDKCVFHEPVLADQVRALMRQADVYVLPSNRQEGWGVVANEAMSDGAVLVANEQAGASQELIGHGQTGFLFKDGAVVDLAAILQTLLADVSLRETVRHAAWLEMQRLWHPRVGAERLVRLIGGLLGRSERTAYTEGPCRNVALRGKQ